MNQIQTLFSSFSKKRVLIVGDVMIDSYIIGKVERVSPEAPVPVVEFERESFMPGGAANVARNLSALQAGTELFSAIGPDQAGQQLQTLLDGVEQCPFHFRGERVTITLSAGLTSFVSGESSEKVFERADQAVYFAKGQGRKGMPQQGAAAQGCRLNVGGVFHQ